MLATSKYAICRLKQISEAAWSSNKPKWARKGSSLSCSTKRNQLARYRVQELRTSLLLKRYSMTSSLAGPRSSDHGRHTWTWAIIEVIVCVCVCVVLTVLASAYRPCRPQGLAVWKDLPCRPHTWFEGPLVIYALFRGTLVSL